MKKKLLFAFVGAIALSGAVGITSCSSDKDVAEEVSPNFNPKTNEVTTQFVFNVSNGSSANTRQSEDATQASSSLAANQFRGIDNSYIMCFKQGSDANYLSAAATAAKSFDMSRVVAAGTLDNANSRRVLEMSLPLNINTMLFYGKAIVGADNHANHDAFGHLYAYHVEDELDNVYFQLGRRLENSTEKTKFQEVQKLLAAVLSCVINTHRGNSAVSADATPDGVSTNYGFDLPADYMANMHWSAYNNVDANKQPLSPVDNQPARPLEIKLFKVYKEMVTVMDAELRNASGIAIKQTVKNLWSIINSVRCAQPTNQEEALAKYMAFRIDSELRKYFNAETVPADGGSVENVTIKQAETLISEFSNDTFWPTASAGEKPASATFSDISNYSSSDMGVFPSQFSLPQGSTHIKFDTTKEIFYYVENYNSSAVGGGTFTVDDYYYPAELCYFGNSPLRVSNAEHVVGDYPENVTKWNSEETTSWTNDWSIGHVQSSTRSVAMKNDINYGTSLLKATVGYNTLTLKDNNKAIQQRDYGVTEDDKTITVNGTSFKLVGVIIGDQWPKVGWNFLPKTSDSDPNYRKGYIYDNQITGEGVIPASTSSTSDPNYTLVFDNYVNETTQPKLFVALELQNNTGIDFFGKDNLISNGSNFYLIGELDPTGKEGPALPTYHALPPYDATNSSDATKTIPRVFIQDHMTTANFKIGENSLKYAYLTVPDLRSSSVTLGLSVDLQWSTGLEFDDVILGGN